MLNPFEMELTECSQATLNTRDKLKLDFLCSEMQVSAPDVFTIAVLVTLGFGLCCCCGSFCLFCRYRAKQNNAIEDDALMAEERQRHDPLAAQRIIEQQNKQKLTLLGKVLVRKKFSQTAHKEN